MLWFERGQRLYYSSLLRPKTTLLLARTPGHRWQCCWSSYATTSASSSAQHFNKPYRELLLASPTPRRRCVSRRSCSSCLRCSGESAASVSGSSSPLRALAAVASPRSCVALKCSFIHFCTIIPNTDLQICEAHAFQLLKLVLSDPYKKTVCQQDSMLKLRAN